MKSLAGADLLSTELPEVPFRISLGRGQLCVEEVLRWLPGRRLTARVRTEDNELVVLKAFVGKQASRDAGRELDGLQAYLQAGLRAPGVVDAARGKVSWLLCQFLGDGHPPTARHVEVLATALACLHRAGFDHQDLHLDNFLLVDGDLTLLDGGAVKRRRLSTSRRVAALGALIAQFDVTDEHIERAFTAYTATAALAPLHRLEAALLRARAKRTRKYRQKTMRNCTEFCVQRVARRRWFARREHKAWVPGFAAEPDAAFVAPLAMLKDGNSATVIRADIGGAPRIIKRYNVKGLVHRVRRAIRPRGRRGWQNTLLTEFWGIPTAGAVALVETGARWLPGPAYLVLDDVGDADLAALSEGTIEDGWVGEILDMARAFRRLGWAHGDFKSTNFLLWNSRWHVVDLDGLRFGGRISGDIQRLLANWPAGHPMREAIRAAIVRAPDFDGA